MNKLEQQKSLAKEMAKDINLANMKIQHHINDEGPYSHNIVSCILRGVEKDWGTELANKLISANNLEQFFGIKEISNG